MKWAQQVETLEQAQVMAFIRNTCRLFMTRHQDEITPEQQEVWWRNLDHAKTRCWIYGSVAPYGYGLVRIEEGREWLSGGLLPEARGQGLGKCLFRHLIQQCRGEPWLEVLATNTMAYGLYRSLGFEINEMTRGIYIMSKRESSDEA